MNEPWGVYEKALIEAMAFHKKVMYEAKSAYDKALVEAKNIYDKALAGADDNISIVYYSNINKISIDCDKYEINLALAKMVWDKFRDVSIEAEVGMTRREIINRAITELKDELLEAEKHKEKW